MTDVVNAPNLAEEIELAQECGILKVKGYRISEISELKGISQAKVKQYVQQYNDILQKTIDANPYFLEEIAQNTMRLLVELDELSKEAYETVEIATRESMVGARVQALKLALDISGRRAQLLQLIGAKSDSSYIERTQKAEQVNKILSNVLQNVVSDCPHCRERTRLELAEAFALMGTDE